MLMCCDLLTKKIFLISTSDFMLFELKTMVKSCLEFYFDIQQAPSELLLTGFAKPAFLADFLPHWAEVILIGFHNKKL